MPKHSSHASRTPTFCGVDLGSTNMKVLLLTENGTVVRRESRPTPRADDSSVNANEIFDRVETLILAACDQRYAVAAVCIAGIGEDGVLLDADLEPLGRALTWFDPRRIDLFDSIRPRLAHLPGTGTDIDAARTLVGWAWAMGQPGAQRARTWVALTDYVAIRWTRSVFMSDTLAARTAAWNVPGEFWHETNVMATLGCLDRLPGVQPAGSIIGPIQSPRLKQAGVLVDGAAAVVGGHDHPVGAWGVSQLDANAVLDSMGTAEVVVGHTPSRQLPTAPRLDIAAGIAHSGLTLLSVIELARNVEWACEDAEVARAIEQIAVCETAPDEYLDSDLFEPGGAGGGRPRYTHEKSVNPRSKASAVLGALARLGADSIDAVSTRLTGDVTIYAAGGWVRSPGWMALKERFSDAPLRIIPETEVTAVGAAMLAARAWDARPPPEVCLSLARRRSATG